MKRLPGLFSLVVASVVGLTGCTTSTGALPSTTGIAVATSDASTTATGVVLSLTLPTSSPPMSTPPSSAPPTVVSSSAAPTSATSLPSTSKPTPSTTTSHRAAAAGPWPSSLSPAQVDEAKAAIAAYVAYEHLVDEAYTKPGEDWSKQATKLAADPERSNFLSNLKATAELGQYTSGSAVLKPQVTKVQPALVHLSVCVDSSSIGFFDKNGRSIKAPNQAGSYYRHSSQIDVGQYVGGQWLVTIVTSDFKHSC